MEVEVEAVVVVVVFCFLSNGMGLAHDDWPVKPARGAGSLEPLVGALEHEDGVGDLEGGAELDAHDLHDVRLGQQEEGLAVNHLRETLPLGFNHTHSNTHWFRGHCGRVGLDQDVARAGRL